MPPNDRSSPGSPETAITHRVVRTKQFTPCRAWDAMDLAVMNGISVRLHWTDQPYRWHVNDGQEVFAVLSGQVDMYVRTTTDESVVTLNEGDIFVARVGCEHLAHPRDAAHILVIETQGSV